jgi:N-acetylated-alpha-linked acidic dipeptidase
LANAEVIPYDVPRYAQDLRGHFDNAVKNVKTIAPDFSTFDQVDVAIKKLELSSASFETARDAALSDNKLSKGKISKINKGLLALEKSWIDPKGMYYGSWYRSLYVSTDPFSGYASWILPGIQYEVEIKSTDRLEEWDIRYANAILDLSSKVDKLTKTIN